MCVLVFFFLIYKTIWNTSEESVNRTWGCINNNFIHKHSTHNFRISVSHSFIHSLTMFFPQLLFPQWNHAEFYLRGFISQGFFFIIFFYLCLADSGGKIKTNHTNKPLVLLIHHPRLYSVILPFPSLIVTPTAIKHNTRVSCLNPPSLYCFLFCDKRAISTISDVVNLSTESFYCVWV